MRFWFEQPGYVVQNTSFATREPAAATVYVICVGISILLGSIGNVLILGAIYVSEVRNNTFQKTFIL